MLKGVLQHSCSKQLKPWARWKRISQKFCKVWLIQAKPLLFKKSKTANPETTQSYLPIDSDFTDVEMLHLSWTIGYHFQGENRKLYSSQVSSWDDITAHNAKAAKRNNGKLESRADDAIASGSLLSLQLASENTAKVRGASWQPPLPCLFG